MLSWPPGRRATDGIWARHWYQAVEGSTGFLPYAPAREPLPRSLHGLHKQCMGYYEQLHAHRVA